MVTALRALECLYYCNCQASRTFPSLLHLCQNESTCGNHSYGNELLVQVHVHGNPTHFLKSRFETEAQANSKVAHWPNSAKKIGSYTKKFLHKIPYFEFMNNLALTLVESS